MLHRAALYRAVKVVHSVNGRATRQAFATALLHFRATHRGSEVQAAAQGANFQPRYVPAGQTDKIEPFERLIFGPVRQKIRGRLALFVHADPDAVVKKGMVANWLVEALVGLHPRVVERAWEIFA
jgi:hypothetical protein